MRNDRRFDILPNMVTRSKAQASASKKPRITIVGAGSLARSLAPALRAVGYKIDEIVSRSNAKSLKKAGKLAGEVGASTVTASTAKLGAEIVWFCVPDGEIASAAGSLVRAGDWKRRIVFHSSGALSGEELSMLRAEGAAVASVHPLMTFVQGSRPSLAGVPFAIEGDSKAVRAARTIVLSLRGLPFNIRKSRKRAYHAWGMFASPLLTALLAMAERVAVAAGITPREARNRMLPILRQTLANYERFGAPGSFSGPIIRGDVDTVTKHLEVLRRVPSAQGVYTALAKAALRELPAKNRVSLKKILDGSARTRGKSRAKSRAQSSWRS